MIWTNDKPNISIVLPAIRQDRWDSLYDSIVGACQRYSFELIICGPLPLTEKLQALSNVKYIKDFGSPMRASNIAAVLAEGDLITWIADDATLAKESIDKNIDYLLGMGDSNKNVVMIKYSEGKNGTEKQVLPDEYFYINNSGNCSPFLPNHWVLFNHCIMYRSFFEILGGWDCDFEACPMGHNDFAVRAQFLGANVSISPFPCLDCDHMEGGSGDHMPIFICQPQRDEPKYRSKYRNPNWTNADPKIDINNWKKSPSVWKERYKSIPISYKDILDQNGN